MSTDASNVLEDKYRVMSVILQGGYTIPPNSAYGTLVKTSIIRPNRPGQVPLESQAITVTALTMAWLGTAIMGKKVGEKATYSLPNGRASTVEILEAVPYVGA